MNLKRLSLGLLPLAGVLLLAACSQSTTAPGSTVTYQVVSNRTAYAVLQKADGSVLTSKTIAAGTTDVTFDNVPAGALITTLVTNYDNHTTHHLAFTAPASVIQGRTIYRFGSTARSFSNVQITGPCPSGSDASTTIRSVAATGLGDGYADSNATTCASNGSGGYDFTLSADYAAADSTGSIVMTLFAQGGALTTPAVARYMTLAPSQTTLAVSAGDWKAATAYSASMTFSPALVSGETAYARLMPYARYNGVEVPLTSTVNNVNVNTVGASSVPFSGAQADLAGTTSYDLFARFQRQTCTPACIDNTVYTERASSTAPLNATLAIGTDTWPMLQTFSWKANATTSPVITYPASSVFASAKTVYADVNATSGGTHNEWEILYTGGAGANGTITYPDLPANLQSFIPVPASTGNLANLTITDVGYQSWWFSAAWPSNSNEVDAETTAATTAGLTSVPHTRGPRFLGGSGLQMR